MLRALRHQHNDCTFLFPPLPGNAGCQAGDDTTLAASQLLLNSTLALKNKAELHLPETYAITTRSFTKPHIYGEQTLSISSFGLGGRGGSREERREAEGEKASDIHSKCCIHNKSKFPIYPNIANPWEKTCRRVLPSFLATWDTVTHKSMLCLQFLKHI